MLKKHVAKQKELKGNENKVAKNYYKLNHLK